jgi:hypothetical protein
VRTFAALLLAFCVGAAAVAWQASGYAFKKVALKWLPKAAVTATLPLEKLGIISSSTTSDEETAQAEADPQQTVATTPPAAEAPATKAAAESTQPPDAATSVQTMARDLANLGQEVETLKATIAELKDSQQQMARELAKANDRANELNARAKLTSVQPHPPTPPARKPVPAYAPSPPVSAAPAYRQPPPYPPTQAAAQPAPVQQSVQPYPQTLPPPPADTGLVTAPRPPMPVQ